DISETSGAIGERTGSGNRGDALLVCQISSVELDQPATKFGSRSQIRRDVAVDPLNGAAGVACREIERSITGVAQAAANERGGTVCNAPLVIGSECGSLFRRVWQWITIQAANNGI